MTKTECVRVNSEQKLNKKEQNDKITLYFKKLYNNYCTTAAVQTTNDDNVNGQKMIVVFEHKS